MTTQNPEKLTTDSQTDEFTTFSFTVKRTNYFKVFFSYSEDMYGKKYYTEVLKCNVHSQSLLKNLDLGRNLDSMYTEGGFGVSTLGELMDAPGVDMNVSFAIRVPFFRKGHYLTIINYLKTTPEQLTILNAELTVGGVKKTLYNGFKVPNKQSSYQIKW